jgi:hypothetical protein
VNFSIKKSLQSSFQIFCQNIFNIVLLSALSVLFLALLQVVSAFFIVNYFKSFSAAQLTSVSFLSKSMIFSFILFRDVFFLLQSLVLLFLTNAFLPAFDGCKVELKNYFPSIKKIYRFVMGAALLLIVPTLFSSISLFVHGQESFQIIISASIFVVIIVLFRYFFFYLDILNGSSVFESLKNSTKATHGNFFSIAFLIVTALLINLAILFSSAFFGIVMAVFILFTLPMTILIFADVYNQLTQDSAGNIAQKRALRIEDEVMESTRKELI